MILVRCTAVLVSLACFVSDAPAQSVSMSPFLEASEVVPPTSAGAWGLAYVHVDPAINRLFYDLTFLDLSVETAAHIHGFAPPRIDRSHLAHPPSGTEQDG